MFYTEKLTEAQIEQRILAILKISGPAYTEPLLELVMGVSPSFYMHSENRYHGTEVHRVSEILRGMVSDGRLYLDIEWRLSCGEG